MNKVINIGLTVIIVLAAMSCDFARSEGDWDDNIHLSTKSVDLPAEATSTMITTGETGWWVESYGWNGDWSSAVGDDTIEENFIIEAEEFTIERRNGTEIHITLTENPTSDERVLVISLQNGNYFDDVTITQAGN